MAIQIPFAAKIGIKIKASGILDIFSIMAFMAGYFVSPRPFSIPVVPISRAIKYCEIETIFK